MATFEAGQVFDRYHILRSLGRSVSGESYEAEDAILLRKVTLKLIHPQETLPDSARRQFFREMQGLSGLIHPYLAAILDYGEFNGRLYVARRYLSDGSLLGPQGRQWFNPPLNLDDAIRCTHQLAQALHSIHLRGYTHGAVTFANVLVQYGPEPDSGPDRATSPLLLADAGLAQFARRFGQQQNRQPLPVTAAPEQIGSRIIPASDQFALAVLLYFWLAGRPPYLGTPEEIERLKLTETITPLSAVNSHVTIEQDGMLLRALSVFPEDRYPTIMAFAEALLSTIPTPSDTPLAAEAVVTPRATETSETSDVLSQPAPSAPAASSVQPEPSDLVEQPQPETEQEPGQVVASDGAPQIPQTDAPQLLEAMKGAHSPYSARVIITSPYADDPVEFSLQYDEITAGRAGSSDILLDHDNLTSRHHALFRRAEHGYVIYDRHSANGVFVNGQKIESEAGYELMDGDHISIGNYELIFRLSPPDTVNGPNENKQASMARQELSQLI